MVGAVLTFFGLMHGEAIGIAKTPLLSLSYLAVSAILYVCAQLQVARTQRVAHREEGRPGVASPS